MERQVVIEPPQQSTRESSDYVNWGMLANVCVTLIVGGAIFWDSGSATAAVVSGVGFFTLFGFWLVGNRSGLFAAVITNGQNNATVRHEAQLKYWLELRAVAPLQVSYSESTAPRLEGGTNFVPAVAPTRSQLRAAAAGWVAQLFDERTKRPIATRLTRNKGQIQIQHPEPDVLKYLIDLEILQQQGNQLYWNREKYPISKEEDVDPFPTLEYAVRSIQSGARVVPLDGWTVGVGGGGWVHPER